MADVEVSELSEAQKTNFCLSYATLLLVDGRVNVDAENLGKILEASGCTVNANLLKTFATAVGNIGQDQLEQFI